MAPPGPHPRTTTVLVLGILALVCSFFCCAVSAVCGPLAWIFAQQALGEIDANPAQYTNRSTLVVGRALGIASVVISVVMVFVLGLVR